MSLADCSTLVSHMGTTALMQVGIGTKPCLVWSACASCIFSCWHTQHHRKPGSKLCKYAHANEDQLYNNSNRWSQAGQIHLTLRKLYSTSVATSHSMTCFSSWSSCMRRHPGQRIHRHLPPRFGHAPTSRTCHLHSHCALVSAHTTLD